MTMRHGLILFSILQLKKYRKFIQNIEICFKVKKRTTRHVSKNFDVSAGVAIYRLVNTNIRLALQAKQRKR
jgi:hypothetical protein